MPRDGQNQTFGREGNPFPRTLYLTPEFASYPRDCGMIVLCFSWGLIVVTWNIFNFCYPAYSTPPPSISPPCHPSAPIASPASHMVRMPLPARLLNQPESLLFTPKTLCKATTIPAPVRKSEPTLGKGSVPFLVLEVKPHCHGLAIGPVTGSADNYWRNQCFVTVSLVISL